MWLVGELTLEHKILIITWKGFIWFSNYLSRVSFDIITSNKQTYGI